MSVFVLICLAWRFDKPLTPVDSEVGDSVDFQILFGALPNHQCVLQALDYVFPESPYEDSILNRYKDPGAGAYSYHRGRVFQATRDISGRWE